MGRSEDGVDLVGARTFPDALGMQVRYLSGDVKRLEVRRISVDPAVINSVYLHLQNATAEFAEATLIGKECDLERIDVSICRGSLRSRLL